MKRPEDNDGWYRSEEPTRLGMIAELQRIRRRTLVRPLPVILVALIITAGVTSKFGFKTRMYTSNVVLAINQGALAAESDTSIPFDQLKEYVSGVLLPDREIEKVIERRAPGRFAKVGAPFALESFRDRLEIFIWKNSFAYFSEFDQNAAKSARIGIEISDESPDVALEIARDLASIAIATHDAQRRKLSGELASQVATMRSTVSDRLDELSATLAQKQQGLNEAERTNNRELAGSLVVEVATLNIEIKRGAEQLKAIDASPDALADRVTEARLDTTITIVDQFKPERVEQSGMVLAMIIAVIGIGSLLGVSLVLGAFDSRVHDVDDVTRLGLPVLGHVPGFPGDQVGSLQARGVSRARVPLLLRWRSHR